MTPVRVMIVDDHSVVREGIRSVLSDAETFTVVAEASSAAEAIAALQRHTPDVVVLDISMPGGSGLHAVPEMLERAPNARVLMLSVHDDAEYVLESARAGARGYLRKDSSPAEVRAAILAVHAGGDYYSPHLAGILARALRGEAGRRTAREPPRAVDALTAREREILVHIAEGLTNREIAAALGISTRTVEAHRDSLIRKLGIRTVAGLTRLTIEQGLLTSRAVTDSGVEGAP
jgi:DNA-binding NarL/FixJ family response regulator